MHEEGLGVASNLCSLEAGNLSVQQVIYCEKPEAMTAVVNPAVA